MWNCLGVDGLEGLGSNGWDLEVPWEVDGEAVITMAWCSLARMNGLAWTNGACFLSIHCLYFCIDFMCIGVCNVICM